MLLALAVILALGGLIGTQVAGLAEDVPRYALTIQQTVDTLQQFIRDMRARFPESTMPIPPNGDAPQTRLMRPDRSATGALPETILR